MFFLGITIYAVGIGKAIEEELREIASDPPIKHLFYAEDFTAMEGISEKLQKRICEGIKHCIYMTFKKSKHFKHSQFETGQEQSDLEA